MPGEGRLIAMCGIDGSGKTVQTEALASRARRDGWTVHCQEFPRYSDGFFGDLIARYLRGEFSADAAAVSPYLAALPFACDRWEAAPQLRARLAEGTMVVCNRYVPANLAHQGGKIQDPAERAQFIQWAERLEYDVFKLPRPHLHVWLDMPPEVAVALLAGKGEREYLRRQQDIHESDMSHLRATWQVYRELAQGGGDWLSVACSAEGRPLPPEQIAEEVWRGVSAVVSV